MSARTALPLFLLMLTWTLPARVHCQTLEASLVMTQYVEITWMRAMLWYGVSDFQVNVALQDNRDCLQSVSCHTPTCSFNTLACGLIQPCTPTTTTVSGGGYTAPALVLVTGPENVADMELWQEEAVQYIDWVNPSKSSSPCYKQTAVRISFNNEISTDYFDHGIESTSKVFNVSGYGEVEMWTEGGDGQSVSSWETFVYNVSDVDDLVTFEMCEAGCTSLSVNWSYDVPLHPDVAYFRITLVDVTMKLQDRSTPDFSLDVPINATSTTVTGLDYDRQYYTCIRAMSAGGEELSYSCSDSCRTAYVVPQNLTVQPLNDSSLRATWKPPLCQPETPIEYKLQTHYEDYYTFDTTYDVGGLDPFHLYELRLEVNGYGHDNDDNATLVEEEYTKLNAPSQYRPFVYQSSVEVSWYHYVENWDDNIYYKVTWGRTLQFHGQTKERSFVITGFNNTDEVVQVCVAAALGGREDLTSQTDCQLVVCFCN